MKRFMKLLLSLTIVVSSIMGNTFTVRAADHVKEYPVIEDAFIRQDRADNKGNYENITKAHGSQYENAGYKVINVKEYTNAHIISLMKFDLPSADEVNQYGFDSYELMFNIFKNADPNNCPQTYRFYYTTDTSWSESSITWNTKPESVKRDGENLLFDFTIEKGDAYEFKSEEEKIIKVDISEKIESLIQSGVQQITVFIVAQESKNTSLMLHSKESNAQSSKLIASRVGYSKEMLSNLISECEALNSKQYSEESWNELIRVLNAAKNVAVQENAPLSAIRSAIQELLAAKEALMMLIKEYPVVEDAYIRQDRGNNKGDYENITKAHGAQYENKGYKVINVKECNSPAAHIISLMKFDLPSAEEAAQYGFDTYELMFHIFKNADPNNCPQTYRFYYTTDTSWTESSVTWNTKPESVKRDGENHLFDFTIEKGDAYENKDEEDKKIKVDITEKIESLIQSGVQQITVFIVAQEAKNTSLMLHSKESSVESSKLIASKAGYSLDMLKKLIDECEALNEGEYTQESWQPLLTALSAANQVYQQGSTDVSVIRSAYVTLKAAKDQLVSNADPSDTNNIAYGKPTRSNLSKQEVSKVNDGKLDTYWSGLFYPSYVDIDLMDTYAIDSMKIYLPAGKVGYYSIYGSNNGADYDRLYQKRSDDAATKDGDLIQFDSAKSYRIVRVYLEYTAGDDKAYLSEVRVYGNKTNSNTQALREGSLENILNVQAYDQTSYAAPITASETIENVYGIIDRTIGAEYRSWFEFELSGEAVSGKDYYELSDHNGKILIKGNEGLSLTTGLNYYFKNYANVHISEQTMQVSMPKNIVPINGVVRKETPYKVRYAYNYCTLSYTFAFFGEEDWQRENDWLALNGVNVVLDLAGQEATWIKFLMNFGYSFDDAKDWLTGPAYYAWQFMDNMEAFGGPVPDGYVKDRLELARKSQRWKNSLGMQTVLQGYAGMVPTNFNEYQPSVSLIAQGNWNGFARPSMIATDSNIYDEYARLFYEAQRFVYGETSNYYAVDPFHEGGKRPSGLSDETIAKEVLESMLAYDADAVWVVQGWQSNPTNGLLKGMGDYRRDHVLIVDLIKYPIQDWTKYDRTKYGSTTLDKAEFNETSWAWCLLANFGGNPSMHGQMEVMVNDILEAQKSSSYMSGIGIISEAMYDNPIMYDLIFDLAWADESFNLDSWINRYIERRYGGSSENIKMAWQIMKDANYDYGVRFTNELFGTKNKTPQSYGKQNIPYGAENLETALRLMLRDYDTFKDNECYRYDLSEMMRQQVSNYAVLKYNDVLDAVSAGNLEKFKKLKEEFLNAFDVLNEVESTQKDQLGGEWIGKATDLAQNYDDFAMDTFEMNAKALITSWGSRAGHRSLKDYGWRNYEGIFKDVYTQSWTDYLNRVEANMESGTPLNNLSVSDYFDIYWKWNLSEQNYTRDPKDSPEEMKAILDRVLDECALSGEVDVNIGNLALKGIAKDAGNENEGSIDNVNDGTVDTSFTAKAFMENNTKVMPSVIVDLIGEFKLSEIHVILDSSEADYEVYISSDGETWRKAAEHSDSSDGIFKLDAGSARYVKVTSPTEEELPIAEIRAYGERVLPDLDLLKELVAFAEGLKTDASDADAIVNFNDALNAAKDAINHDAAPDEVNSVYWNLYDAITALNLSGIYNLALKKPVSAHNDPSGNSSRLVDGDLSTHWNAGRLSITGKPYEDKITPGWAIVDLGKIYEVNEIQISFSNAAWHHYEVFGSLDGDTWIKLGEKTTNSLPNAAEDNYKLTDTYIRYVKLALNDVQVGSDGKRISVGVNELIVLGKEMTVNKNALLKLIDEANALHEEDYTTASWAAFMEVLNEAKNAAEAELILQSEIDAAAARLKEALAALVKRGDMSELNQLLDICKQLKEEEYTEESWQKYLVGYQSILELIKNNADLTQEEIDQAVEALKNAMNELIYKEADYTAVEAAIAKANELDKSLYKNFDEVEKAINAVVRGKNITEQAEVDAMAKAIEEAVAGLVYKDADYSAVDEAIAKANELDRSLYKNFDDVEKAINAVARGKNITQQTEVDAMAAAIEAALAGLVRKDQGENAPSTYDDSQMMLMMILLILSLGILYYSKKKEYSA